MKVSLESLHSQLESVRVEKQKLAEQVAELKVNLSHATELLEIAREQHLSREAMLVGERNVLCVCVCVSVCLFLCLSVFLFVCLCPFLHTCTHMHTSFMSLSLRLSIS